MVADDSATIRRIVVSALHALGYTDVVEAADGKEALAKCDSSIELMVVDHWMPGISGAEVIRELRRRPTRLPIVLMSGLSAAELGVESAQPDAFLRKPFELADLAQTVREVASTVNAPQEPAVPPIR